MNARDLYLDLLKRTLTDSLYDVVDPAIRREGRDWPARACTMIGLERLDNLQRCIEDVVAKGVAGDFIETGVWRGGATIFMRALLKLDGVSDRTVWVADSFKGLPPPDASRYPADDGDRHHTMAPLAVSLDAVRANFEKFAVLDDGVRFLEGWFEETLSTPAIRQLAILRLDGDMYSSTMQALEQLYPRLSAGGYVIVDDYGAVPGCRQAVDDFRARNGITDVMSAIDWTGVFWQRGSQLETASDSGTTASPFPERRATVGRGGSPTVSTRPKKRARPGDGRVRILDVEVMGQSSGHAILRSGERCPIKVTLVANRATSEVVVSLRILNSFGLLVYSTRTDRDRTLMNLDAGSTRAITFDVPMTVALGTYRIELEVRSDADDSREQLDYMPSACELEVSGFLGSPFDGTTDLGAGVTVERVEALGNEYVVGREVDFTNVGNSHLYTRGGWADSEEWARWTDGPEAELFFRLREPPRQDLVLTALVQPFCPTESLKVDTIVNGRLLVQTCFAAPGSLTRLELEIPRVSQQDYIHVLFRMNDPKVPAELGDSMDERALGLAFRRLVISESPAR